MSEKSRSPELERAAFKQFLKPHVTVEPTEEARTNYYVPLIDKAERGETVWIADLLSQDGIVLDLYVDGISDPAASLWLASPESQTATLSVWNPKKEKLEPLHVDAKANMHLLRAAETWHATKRAA